MWWESYCRVIAFFSKYIVKSVVISCIILSIYLYFNPLSPQEDKQFSIILISSLWGFCFVYFVMVMIFVFGKLKRKGESVNDSN